jgi:hypothetical protein
MVRVAHDPETRLYVERRLKQGETKHVAGTLRSSPSTQTRGDQ